MRVPDRTDEVAVADGVKLAAHTWNAKAPPPAAFARPLAVVLVHQWSKMGGCSALMRGMAVRVAEQGLPVVTFDQRGVGRSSGRSTFTGLHEVKDVEAVCKWAHETLKRDVILVGSSAGAPIAGSAAAGVKCVKAYVGIGYVFGWLASWVFGRHFPAVLDVDVPKLFVMGDRDAFTPVRQLRRNVEKARGTADMHLFEGVGHFELEGEQFDARVVDVIVRWVCEQMPLLAA